MCRAGFLGLGLLHCLLPGSALAVRFGNSAGLPRSRLCFVPFLLAVLFFTSAVSLGELAGPSWLVNCDVL